MSLSQQTESTNPCTRWLEWQGSEGKLKYWDREAKENIYVKLPFKFLVLDILSTVKGFDDSSQMGYWANEIRDTRTDILTVRTKQGVRAQGLYADVKQLNGIRFTQSVYIAYKNEEGDLVIGNFQMHGVSNSAFIEFRKQNKIYGKTVILSGSTDGKKGATKYKIPTFEIADASPETVAEATELDRELQEYLKAYLVKKTESEDEYTGGGADDDEPYFPPMEDPTDAEIPDDASMEVPF